MEKTLQEKNKATVLEAFDTLFNKRDYAAAEKFWSPERIGKTNGIFAPPLPPPISADGSPSTQRQHAAARSGPAAEDGLR